MYTVKVSLISCAVTLGEVFSIGRGTYGQLGLGESNAEDAKEPKRVSSLPSSCLSVDASSSVSFAVCKDGKVSFTVVITYLCDLLIF